MARKILFLIALMVSQLIMAQSVDELNEKLINQRFETLSTILNYRFKGGAGEFERVFLTQVNYTEQARRNCVIGIVIMTFTVSCDNEISDLKFRNPMHHGLNEELQKFLESTDGKWNSCQDEKYTRFEVPVLFNLKGTETNGRGFLTLVGDSPGFTCRGDDYYIERFEKYKNKGRKKKALEVLDQLIRRDPYNNTYYEQKRQLLSNENE